MGYIIFRLMRNWASLSSWPVLGSGDLAVISFCLVVVILSSVSMWTTLGVMAVWDSQDSSKDSRYFLVSAGPVREGQTKGIPNTGTHTPLAGLWRQVAWHSPQGPSLPSLSSFLPFLHLWRLSFELAPICVWELGRRWEAIIKCSFHIISDTL